MKRALITVLIVICAAALLTLAGCGKSSSSDDSSSSTDQVFDSSQVNDEENTQTQTTTQTTAPTEQAQPEQTATPTPTASGVIVIDPGHQASADYNMEPIGPGASEEKIRVSDGAEGVETGNPESLINLQIGLKLRDALEARGFTVIMVRDSQDVDISNSERAAIANENNAMLFIRLHCDGIDDSSVKGFLTLIPAENEWTSGIVNSSAEAANIMHPIIVSETGAVDRGINERSDLSGFNWCTVPTVLFEMGCLSNPDEDEALSSDAYQTTMANAIADATVAYANQS